VALKEPPFEQGLEINKIGITGKRGETLVGRIPKSGWTQRANLPILQACGDQKIDEPSRFDAERTDSGGSRERSWMQENPGRACLEPGEKRICHF
jgi:hypothetical protein